MIFIFISFEKVKRTEGGREEESRKKGGRKEGRKYRGRMDQY